MQVVFEATGYRQGLVVGDYFKNAKNAGIEEAARQITNTYASAGWGGGLYHQAVSTVLE